MEQTVKKELHGNRKTDGEPQRLEHAALMQKLATLAQTTSLEETLQSTLEIIMHLGTEPKLIRLVRQNQATEIAYKSASSPANYPETLEESFEIGLLVFTVICSVPTTTARVQLHKEIRSVLQVAALQAEMCARKLWRSQDKSTVNANGVIGCSRHAVELMKDIKRVASSKHNVLILGETGTGKTTAARNIHKSSKRNQAPHSFVEFNCANFTETLVEAELFGTMKGAFTGADRDRKGLFEEANGGTLFLDEIGDIPLATQAKLLKAIEEKKIKRLGSNRYIDCDIRIIAATARDLSGMVDRGEFRADLYYRLAVLEIRTHPLREQRADIPFLLNHFLMEEQRSAAREMPYEIEEAAIRLLRNYDWPGNIRLLQNVVSKLTNAAQDDRPITVEDVRYCLKFDEQTKVEQPLLCSPEQTPAIPVVVEEGQINVSSEILALGADETLRQYLARVQKCVIEATREQCDGSMWKAAKRLGMTRSNLDYLLRTARALVS